MGGIFPSTISVESILAWQDVCAAEYRIEEIISVSESMTG